MWATEEHPEHEGITGVTFDSDGHRLVGTLYLARGEEPKPTALLLHGCPGLEKNLDLAGCAAVDPGRIAVVGHSLGGWAAIVTAAAEPRLRAVAVCGAAARLECHGHEGFQPQGGLQRQGGRQGGLQRKGAW
ncbi:MAG: alpha/beta hydrolase family protein [Streptosporangiaceae bacterium]